MRIVLFADSAGKEELCLRRLENQAGVLLETYSRVADFLGECAGVAYNGFIADIPTLLAQPDGDRKFVYSLDTALPVLFLSLEGKRKTAAEPLPAPAPPLPVPPIEEFVRCQCLPPPGRQIRRFPRRTVMLNARLGWKSAGPEFENTRLLDISRSGCFIVSRRRPRKNETLYLLFNDLEPSASLPCRLRWLRQPPPGSGQPYGLGLEFARLNAFQRFQIAGLLN